MFDFDSYVDPYPHVIIVEKNFFLYKAWKEWLNENVGLGPERLYGDWTLALSQYGKYHFMFKREEDKVKFILKWL